MTWGAMAAVAFPHLLSLGLSESTAALATSMSGAFAIISVIIIAYSSGEIKINVCK
jgi:hypothetical protein